VTRFILICNYVTRIIEPLASRCAKFRFHSLPPASMKERLMAIARAEGCGDGVFQAIDAALDVADGDMRRAVTTLQSVHTLALGGEGSAIDANAIAEMVGRTPPAVVDELWTACASPEFDTMRAAVEEFCASGFSAQLLLGSLLPKLLEDPVLTEACKADISIRMAEAEKNMTDGADEYLQLTTVCSLIQNCFHKSMQARQ
jgi:replication factor C subunit 2/4